MREHTVRENSICTAAVTKLKQPMTIAALKMHSRKYVRVSEVTSKLPFSHVTILFAALTVRVDFENSSHALELQFSYEKLCSTF